MSCLYSCVLGLAPLAFSLVRYVQIKHNDKSTLPKALYFVKPEDLFFTSEILCGKKRDRGPHSLLRFLKRCTLSQHTCGSVPVVPAWHSQSPGLWPKVKDFVPSVPQTALVIPQLQMALLQISSIHVTAHQHPLTMIPPKAKPHSLQLNLHFLNYASF